MPRGSGATKRYHAVAVHAAKLKAQGWTSRAIAEAIGKRPEQIKALVVLGERLRGCELEQADKGGKP